MSTMDNAAAIRFVEQFPSGNYTEAQHREFLDWLVAAPEAVRNPVLDAAMEAAAANAPSATTNHHLVQRIETALDRYQHKHRHIALYRRIAAAAAIVLLLTAAGWWFTRRQTPAPPQSLARAGRYKNDLAPGSSAAILTLSGGRQVLLDSSANGQVATQGSAALITHNGQLSYTGASHEKETVYNTLNTPRGRQYQLTMSDGTQVWLNAASSIRYPVAFTGKERRVEVRGEAYFEVARNASMPFRVSISPATSGEGGGVVEVLGTSFNINAYPDEALSKITLLTGSVKVSLSSVSLPSPPGEGQKLLPGQQAQIGNGKPIRVITDADLEEVIAWKNGRFIFSGSDIRSVMRQLARWYDVEIIYQGPVTKEEFVGAISRFENISQILDMLEKTHTVTFSVEGRKVTVLPYSGN